MPGRRTTRGAGRGPGPEPALADRARRSLRTPAPALCAVRSPYIFAPMARRRASETNDEKATAARQQLPKPQTVALGSYVGCLGLLLVALLISVWPAVEKATALPAAQATANVRMSFLGVFHLHVTRRNVAPHPGCCRRRARQLHPCRNVVRRVRREPSADPKLDVVVRASDPDWKQSRAGHVLRIARRPVRDERLRGRRQRVRHRRPRGCRGSLLEAGDGEARRDLLDDLSRPSGQGRRTAP